MKYYLGDGLLNDTINKLPFELHIPGYNFCGPGTKLKKRLARGDQGVNGLDEACKSHDIAYMQNKELSKRHEADKVLAHSAMNRFRASDASFGEKMAAIGVASAMMGKVKLGKGYNNSKQNKNNCSKLIRKCFKAVERIKKSIHTSLKNIDDFSKTLEESNIKEVVPARQRRKNPKLIKEQKHPTRPSLPTPQQRRIMERLSQSGKKRKAEDNQADPDIIEFPLKRAKRNSKVSIVDSNKPKIPARKRLRVSNAEENDDDYGGYDDDDDNSIVDSKKKKMDDISTTPKRKRDNEDNSIVVCKKKKMDDILTTPKRKRKAEEVPSDINHNTPAVKRQKLVPRRRKLDFSS